MPQIPDFISTVAPQAGGINPRVIADRSIDLGGIIQPLQEFNDKYLAAKRVSETSDHENANTKALADLEYKWSKVPDRAKAMAGFDADVAALKKQNVDTINDPLMRAAVGTHFNDQAVSRSLQTGDNAFRLESSAEAGKLDQSQLDNADLAAKAGNDNIRIQIQDTMNRQIDAKVAAGWITPEDGVRRKANFNNDVASLSAQKDIDGDPYATKKRLQGDGYKGLLPQERENLIHNADVEIRRREAEARQRANEAKALYIAQQRDLYEQDMAMAGDGKSGNLTSPASLTQAFGDKAAAVLWANLQERKNTAVAVTAMGTASPQARADAVKASEPQTTVLPSGDISTLNLTPQEENLYQHHVKNVTGGGAVHNDDGSYSSVSQTSQEHDGKFYNIPTVWDGQHHTEDQAVARADAQGWEQWPSYPTRDAAEARYAQMHVFMEKDTPGQTQGNIRYKEQAANHDALARADAMVTKAYADDGAAAALAFSPQVQTAWAAAAADPAKTQEAIRVSIQTQHGAGVADGQERILTKDQAADAVRRINAARGDDATNIMQTESAAFGPLYWNKAYGELVAAGLNPAYQVLATTPPGAASDSARLTLSRQLEAGPDAIKAMANTTRNAVDSAVDDALTHWTATIQYTPDGPRLRDNYSSAIRLVAYSYTQAGMAPDKAAQRAAAELLLNKYDFVQDTHYNARTPRGGEDLVKTFSLHVEASIAPSDMPDPDLTAAPMFQHPELSPEARKLDYYYRAIQGGTWVTNEHDDGWRLLDQTGLPVRLANGKEVSFLYSEADAAGYTGGVFGRHKPLPTTLPGGIPRPQYEEIKPIETPGVFKQ